MWILQDPCCWVTPAFPTRCFENLTVATHRIVEVIPDGMTLDREGNVVAIDTSPVTDKAGNVVAEVTREYHLRFRTKGDANNNVDGTPVLDVNVVGSPVFAIPYLGYVANYIQNPPGTYVAISAGAILLLLVFLPDLLFDDKEAEKKKKKKNGEADESVGATEGDEVPAETPVEAPAEAPAEETHAEEVPVAEAASAPTDEMNATEPHTPTEE